MGNDAELDHPATKRDIVDATRDLREFIRERELSSIRWFVGTFVGAQIAYFAITLGAVYFMINQLAPHLAK
jgi:hypothetical protein